MTNSNSRKVVYLILGRDISETYMMQCFFYTDEILQNAVAEVLNANTSYRDVGSMFCIPKSTLNEKVCIFLNIYLKYSNMIVFCRLVLKDSVICQRTSRRCDKDKQERKTLRFPTSG